MGEAHDERLPSVRVDVVGFAGKEQVFLDVDSGDFEFEGHDKRMLDGLTARALRLESAEGILRLEHGLQLDRAFGDPGRLDEGRGQRGQSGGAEFVFHMAIAPACLPHRNRIGPGGFRQPVDRIHLGHGRQTEDAFLLAPEVFRGLRIGASDHATPVEKPGGGPSFYMETRLPN